MKHKIAIYVEGGLIQGIRSNIPPDLLDIEIVDADGDNQDEARERWDVEIQTELPFGNY